MSLGTGRVRRAQMWVTMNGLLAAVAACSGDDDETPGEAPSTAESTTSTVPEFVPTPIAWQPCEDDLECAKVTVPVDYGQPAGPTLVLSVPRAPASGQRDSRPAIISGGHSFWHAAGSRTRWDLPARGLDLPAQNRMAWAMTLDTASGRDT